MLKLLLGAILASLAYSADIPNSSKGDFITLANKVIWGSTGNGNSDNSYMYFPAQAQACISVQNNNPTTSHTYTITVLSTSDPTAGSVSGPDSWKWITDGSATQTIGATSTNQFGDNVSGRAQLAIRISGSVTAVGTPDTMTLVVGQGHGISCDSAGALPVTQFVSSFIKFATDYDSGLVVSIPTMSTSLTTGTIAITDLWCVNTTGSTLTLTITNTAGGAYVQAFSILANSIFNPFFHKALIAVGIKWNASGAGVNCQVVGFN